MTRTIALLLGMALLAVGSTAYALYSVADTGTWPNSWPSELEPLRKQSRTFVGPHFEHQHFAVHFTDRDEFESAWPHILAVKSKGAPIFLVRGPNFFLGDKTEAGVIIHCPPEGRWDNPATPEAPIQAYANESRSRWSNTNYIELVVDGKIVDLNRIPLPSDALIVDERFPRADGPSDESKSPN